jgi:hypothetical protein
MARALHNRTFRPSNVNRALAIVLRWPRWMKRAALAASTVAIFMSDFPWGDFQHHAHWRNVRWIPFVTPPVHAFDVAQNIVLFLPFGVFGRLIDEDGGCLRVCLVGFALAVTMELTQVFSHSRIASATDVSCNVAGAVLGCRGAQWWLATQTGQKFR